jgi:hypothetical protein
LLAAMMLFQHMAQDLPRSPRKRQKLRWSR